MFSSYGEGVPYFSVLLCIVSVACKCKCVLADIHACVSLSSDALYAHAQINRFGRLDCTRQSWLRSMQAEATARTW